MSAIVDDIVRRLAAGVDGDLGIPGKVVKFNAGEDGVIVLDSSGSPAKVLSTDRPADCTVTMAADSLLAEGAQRLVDLRAYGRLNAAAGIGAPGDTFQSALPLPKSQLDTRGVTSITPECK